MVPLPLGLACVASATRQAGHEVSWLDLMFVPDAQAALRETIAGFRPEIIGISVRNIDDQKMSAPRFLLDPVKAIVSACHRESKAPVVLGGAGYSMYPSAVLRYLGADLGIPGDGEVAFPTLLKTLEGGYGRLGSPGICVAASPLPAEFPERLDDFPLPEPQAWISPLVSKADAWIPVQSQRGCPMHCSFCATSVIQGSVRRTRSSEQVVKWLRTLREAGYCNLAFVDNTFNLPASHAKELCRQIAAAKLGLNLWCIVYPKWVDAELVDLMQRAGCQEASLGFESGSEQVLRNFNKHFNPAEVRSISQMFAQAGIRRRGFLMLGGPGETRESVEESLDFADSLQLDGLSLTVGIRIYPQTALCQTAIEQGIIRADDDLLAPRFYLAPPLLDWLPRRAAEYTASRPWVQ